MKIVEIYLLDEEEYQPKHARKEEPEADPMKVLKLIELLAGDRELIDLLTEDEDEDE
jgi:hypothetical protein